MTRGQTIEKVNIQMMEELKAMDIDADPEEALQIFLYYMQLRENSYMSIESGSANRPMLEKGSHQANTCPQDVVSSGFQTLHTF